MTIYIVSIALYLFLLQGLLACLTIPCLCYCISLAIKPFLYSRNVLTVPFLSSTTLSNCIPFKNTIVVAYDSIQTRSKKDSDTICKMYNSSNCGLNKTHVENTQGKHTMKKISVFVGNTYYCDT